MDIQLKGGESTNDRRLDRVKQFDERSRAYPIRAALPSTKPRSYTWSCNVFLDQGQEGACVGFSLAHELNARPVVVHVDADYARNQIYREARKIDEWPGEDYEGTSVLAGAKILHNLGYFTEYRWAFGLDDLILAVGRHGPAVLGVNWYEGQFDPDPNGFIHVGGELAGGHAILCNGVNLKGRYFTLHNSWGQDWGNNGECKISFEDIDRLLHEQGEVCVPVMRSKKAILQSTFLPT